MAIESVCPDCGQIYEAYESDIGKAYICPSCHTECLVPSSRVEPGSRWQQFEVIRPLGAGASSEVHLARDLRARRVVALKILFVDEVDSLTDTERFMREATNAKILDHPGIIKIYEVAKDHGHHFLAMEYVEGDTLESLLADHGPLNELDGLSVVRNVADALAYAWDELGLIHRDIKPANIMLSFAGETKLMDLGIAQSVLDLKRLTDPDTVIGSPPYMSPEQCSPRNTIDFKADIYSLGASFYHLVTNQYPFFGKDPVDTVRMQLYTPLPDPREYAPELSEDSFKLLRRMMAKSAANRHDTWEELIAEVDAILERLGG